MVVQFCFIQMPLKIDLAVLTVSFVKKKKNDLNNCTYGNCFTHGHLLKCLWATETENYKKSLEWIQLIYF